MQQRPLGRTGERVSALGFGCMGLVGWYGTRNDAEARATLIEAMDRGITHLDTAAAYQNGDNERFVGAAIRGRRDTVFLATKFGIGRTPDGKPIADNRPESIRASCDASLERLGIVSRSSSPTDRRRAVLRLTAAGRVLDRERTGTVESAVRAALEGVSPAAVVTTAEVLAKVAAELRRTATDGRRLARRRRRR